jgi:hypothetical protein
MTVLVWPREASRAAAHDAGWAVADSKESFFAQCDVLSLHMHAAHRLCHAGGVRAAAFRRLLPGGRIRERYSDQCRKSEGAGGSAFRSTRTVIRGAALYLVVYQPLRAAVQARRSTDRFKCIPCAGYPGTGGLCDVEIMPCFLRRPVCIARPACLPRRCAERGYHRRVATPRDRHRTAAMPLGCRHPSAP